MSINGSDPSFVDVLVPRYRGRGVSRRVSTWTETDESSRTPGSRANKVDVSRVASFPDHGTVCTLTSDSRACSNRSRVEARPLKHGYEDWSKCRGASVVPGLPVTRLKRGNKILVLLRSSYILFNPFRLFDFLYYFGRCKCAEEEIEDNCTPTQDKFSQKYF